MSNYEFLQYERDGNLAVITLDREPLNVLHNPMMAELNSLLDEVLQADDLPAALVFKAKHKAFCAGVDVADHTEDKVGEMIDRFHGIFRRLAASDVLSIAVVGRAALGGGCELACFCDIVLASAKAKFGQPEVQVGVLPPVAACFLPQQVGLKKAVELNVLGATIGAAEAKEIGLVNQVFPVETFDEQVGEYLEQIQKLSRPVVRMAKKCTVLTERKKMLKQLKKVEKLYLDELMKLADAHEGIAAFLEKREPEWKHE